MGLGFLLMAILRAKKVEPTPITLSLPRSFGQITLLVLGILVTLSGTCLLYNPDLLYPYVAGIGIVVVVCSSCLEAYSDGVRKRLNLSTPMRR